MNMKSAGNFAAALLLAIAFASAAPHSFAKTPQQTPVAPTAANPPQSTAAPTAATSSPAPKSQPAAMSPALLHAQDFYRSGKFDLAAAEYSAIISGNGPDAAAACAGLARLYLKQKKPADAYPAAQKAVALDPHLGAAHVALAEVYFRQGKLSDAEHEFQIPLKEKTPDARAYLGLSRIYRATSNYKMAKTALDAAHQLDPEDPDIRRSWLGTLSLKDRLKALQEYLAGRTNDDDETHENLEHSLVVLEDESNRPVRGCHLVNKIAATQTKLERLMIDPKRIRGYGLKVKFNDTTARLLLDTGAGGILVNRKIAEKAGVQRIVEQKLGGIGDKGQAGGYVGYAESLQIGELQFQNCYVDVVENNRSLNEDGLIGADVFAHFLVDIDFPNESFKLSELPKLPDEPAETATLDTSKTSTYHPHDRYMAPEMQSYTRVFRLGHMLLIPVSVNEHPVKLFLIDTGSFDNTITPAAARESTKIYSDDRMRVKGLNGEVKNVFMAEDVNLTFAHFKQKKTIVAFDLTHISDSVGTEISGTLGFGMLFMLDIRIDYRDGLVDFSFDPNRFH
jgi:tetratricopeptide (TPR) repeat protein